MGVRKQVKKTALGFSNKAMERLFADEKRAMQVASAVGKVQEGKKQLGKAQAKVLNAFSFASQTDFKGLGKQLSGLKRRARELDKKLGALG